MTWRQASPRRPTRADPCMAILTQKNLDTKHWTLWCTRALFCWSVLQLFPTTGHWEVAGHMSLNMVIFCEKCLLREAQINRWISCAHARNWWYTPDWYTRNHIFLAKLVVGWLRYFVGWLRYFVGAMVRVLQPFPTTGHWEVAGHTSLNIIASIQNIAKSHILEMWMIIVHGGVHQRRCIAWILESCRIILQCLFSRQLL